MRRLEQINREMKDLAARKPTTRDHRVAEELLKQALIIGCSKSVREIVLAQEIIDNYNFIADAAEQAQSTHYSRS